MGRRATLDEIEGRDDSAASRADSLSAHLRRVRPYAEGTGPDDAPLGCQHRCWCGIAYPHDWPGKASGAPHPREHL